MTAPTESQNISTRTKGSYRLCGACGILVRRAEPVCPECGAPTGDHFPGEPSHAFEKTAFGFLTVLLTLGALVLLSQNRDAARGAESVRLRILEPIDPADLIRPTIPEHTARPAETAAPAFVPAAPPPPPSGPETADTPAPFPSGGPETSVDDDPFGHPHPRAPLTPPAPGPAEPEPPSRAERIQQRRAELIGEYTRVLDENHPMYRPGERITLRLNDGTTQTGILQQLAGGQVQLRLPTGETRWFFSRQLTPETRIRVDPSERQTLVQERAWTEALREMQSTN